MVNDISRTGGPLKHIHYFFGVRHWPLLENFDFVLLFQACSLTSLKLKQYMIAYKNSEILWRQADGSE